MKLSDFSEFYLHTILMQLYDYAALFVSIAAAFSILKHSSQENSFFSINVILYGFSNGIKDIVDLRLFLSCFHFYLNQTNFLTS